MNTPSSELMSSGRWVLFFTRDLAQKLSAYPYLFDTLVILMSFLAGALVVRIVRRAFVRVATARYSRRAAVSEDARAEIVALASSVVWMIPVLTVNSCSWVAGMHLWLARLLLRVGLAACALLTMRALVHGVNLIGILCRTRLDMKNRPIDGFLASVRAFIFAAGAVCAVSLLVGKSPVYLLSAVGAAAAVLMIVFQDSLLSLAASVQVNSSRLVNIGDWIVQRDKGVDGTVEAITLHTVKVRNWDASLVTLPVRALVDESFVNMTRMQEGGARRYKREFLIDHRSVRFLRRKDMDDLRRFERRLDRMFPPDGRDAAGTPRPQTDSVSPEFRYDTNLGLFRSCLMKFLTRHPSVCHDKIMYVTVREPTSQGVPLEIYAFTNRTDGRGYNAVAAGITEDVLAFLPSFHLHLFQEWNEMDIDDDAEVVDELLTYESFVNASGGDRTGGAGVRGEVRGEDGDARRLDRAQEVHRGKRDRRRGEDELDAAGQEDLSGIEEERESRE